MYFYIKEGGNSDFIQGEFLQKVRRIGDNKLEILYQSGESLVLEGTIDTFVFGQYIIRNCFRQILAIVQELPCCFTDEDILRMMPNNRSSTCYIEHGVQPTNNQGWKMHISASSYADYMYKLGVLIPELNSQNICYKVLRPSQFGKLSSTQAGKLFTIYLDDLNHLPKLSQKALNCLFTGSSIPVKGEKQVGASYFRYGAYRGKYILNQKNEYVADIRGIYKPNFIADVNWENMFC